MRRLVVTHFLLDGLAAKNPVSGEFKKEVLKYVPIMLDYNLREAAIFLQDWVTDSMPLEPLLDVSACRGECLYF